MIAQQKFLTFICTIFLLFCCYLLHEDLLLEVICIIHWHFFEIPFCVAEMISNRIVPSFKYLIINLTWSSKCKLLNLDWFLQNWISIASILWIFKILFCFWPFVWVLLIVKWKWPWWQHLIGSNLKLFIYQ